ncbi:aldo/keto reductase [Kribbella sandramycini]|uniref:Aldo/keto reductase n=1 Tax=Kribbella sandramycini TaxID=60450 RepID=A0A7Y4P0F9_9ACTN|nr:aldo/keto reductase [Kribbella sandramycini]MBB6566222.1 D-threo-aldose 1-dehydrogenase [Kribbella sandramycini]NOL43112.1 aldo/keto reductase [Kribbella sandramycini]
MRTVELGRTGLEVSRLGLGLASLGGMFAAVPEPQAIATIDRAWELGIRLFDTAPVYGYGRSEQRAGLALRGRPRGRFVLSTKVGRLIEPGGPDIQPIWAEPPVGLGPRLDYSYAAVIRSFEASLERMGIDRIDILHIHDPDLDFATASTEALRALRELRGRGTIRAISLGINHADVAARFLRETGADGPDVILLAGRYSLLDQSATEELLPLCEKLGVAVLAAGVFQGGVLADTAAGAPHGYAKVPPALLERIDQLRALCHRYDVPLLAAAVQFPLRHPVVPAVVVGARTPQEITEVAAWLEHDIPEAFWAQLL